MAVAFAKGRESLGIEIARELVDAAPERDARDRSLRLLLDYVDDPQEVSDALRRLSSPSSHEKRRLVEILLAESDYDTLITMSHWGEVVDARTIVDVAKLLTHTASSKRAYAGCNLFSRFIHLIKMRGIVLSATQTPAFEASIALPIFGGSINGLPQSPRCYAYLVGITCCEQVDETLYQRWTRFGQSHCRSRSINTRVVGSS